MADAPAPEANKPVDPAPASGEAGDDAAGPSKKALKKAEKEAKKAAEKARRAAELLETSKGVSFDDH